MRTTLCWILGLIFSANGLAMLFAPELWYALTPGVVQTGPYNLHLVRDVGCAYLVSGLALLWLLRNPRVWPAALAGAAFQGLHALMHIWDALAGRVAPAHLLSDALLVGIPTAVMLWLAWPPRAQEVLP